MSNWKLIKRCRGLYSLMGCLTALQFSALPAEGLSPKEAHGWPEVYTLENEVLRVEIAPAAGRILSLSFRGEENLFTRNAAIAGQRPEDAGSNWLNHGGDWIWPVHQGQWESIGGIDFPPPQGIEGSDWQAEASIREGGTSVVILRRTLGDPFYIAVERRFLVAPGASPDVRVQQSIRRIQASRIPVCLWQISQVKDPDAVILGIPPEATAADALQSIAFNPLPADLLTRCEDGVQIEPMRGTEHKVGTAGSWIAARKGDTVLLQWTTGGRQGGALPDGGCGLVMYANTGLGYAEIESQSAEVLLAPGEVLKNELVMRLLRVEAGLEVCEQISRLSQEATPPPTVTFSISEPMLGDAVTVQVRNPDGGGMLHWGVNGAEGDWELPHESYWPAGSSPGDSGVAVDTPLPPPVSGVSTLTLGPFRNPEQVVRSLHSAVRWGEVWDSNEGANYSLSFETSSHAANLKWTEEVPDKVGGHVSVEIVTDPMADHLRLFRDGNEIAASEDGRIRVDLSTRDWAYGATRLTAIAERQGALSAGSRTFWKLPELTPAELPESTPYGAHPEGDALRFHLLAPGAFFVEVEWRRNGESGVSLMHPVEGGRWTLSLPYTPGEILEYRYRIDGTFPFADPWSQQVVWIDPQSGKASHRSEHAWTVAGGLPPAQPPWTPPDPATWVIYELSIPDVAPPGTYRGLQDHLDWIESLGVNAIEPLPVTEFPGAESWGYNPAFHMAAETSYGTPQDLRELIVACRARGIAFIKDIVLNHIDGDAPLVAMHGPLVDHPFTQPFEGFNWGFPKLNQQSPAFQRYQHDVLTHWVRQWGVDGFRYDATQWIQWSGYKDWGASWMSYVVEQENPDVVQIAENLPGEPAMVEGTELDTEWDAHYRWRMREALLRQRISEPEKFREILDPRSHAYTSGRQRVPYIESHDEERFVRELLQAGFSETEALRRHLAAAAVTLTVPGMPMLYAGQEWGETTKKVVGLNPLQWQRAEEPVRVELVEAFRALIELRTQHRALHHDKIELLRVDPATGTVVYRRPGVPESILVALNVSPHATSLDLSEAGRWVGEVAADASEAVDLGEVLLLPGQARVFVVE